MNFPFRASILKVTKIHNATISLCQFQQVLYTEEILQLTVEVPPMEQLYIQMPDKREIVVKVLFT